jgi:DNA-binding GntR family transcriptional regulator
MPDVNLGPAHTPTKAEVAYTVLREAIRSGRLAPGERVTLNGLAEQLEMSLTPVREALRRLAEHGLVEQVPNRGTVIARHSAERVAEIYRLRLALEPMAAERAAGLVTDTDVREIEAALDAVDEATRANADISTVGARNAEFHRRVYRAARSPMLEEFVARLWNALPFQAVVLENRYETSAREHRELVDALARRDPAAAREILHRHISDAAASAADWLDRD